MSFICSARSGRRARPKPGKPNPHKPAGRRAETIITNHVTMELDKLGLEPAQRRACFAIAFRRCIHAAAREARVSPGTIRKWARLPSFCAAIGYITAAICVATPPLAGELAEDS